MVVYSSAREIIIIRKGRVGTGGKNRNCSLNVNIVMGRPITM